mmetsp:Transcript_17782/g.27663  ORF Transcript_17782/g.27663 Transcript_17782/m.27663 type:complete len:307 (-) Transcript_17782:1921-2841(-)|eukprot:CAMPEP_0196809974 /NCGR_PEP_ID=MMETSP1362-20130617/9836_1 /TAXON_ID=163516 /ORGANISM="Leptocylindrus danicus, Strain CCMP1856" /LENGTH=306 /DNA_ID=CAMNT_0042184825 /DNA_START=72 /DNA_END=992 /DNA_ORIENTATION=-
MTEYNAGGRNGSAIARVHGRMLVRATTLALLFSGASSASFVSGVKSIIGSKTTATDSFRSDYRMRPRTFDEEGSSSSSSLSSMNNRDMDSAAALSNTRRRFLGGALLLSSLTFGSAARAAIPTIDDYETTTTGAVIKPKVVDLNMNTLVKELGRKHNLSGKTDVGPFSEELLKSLTALQVLVDQADWASVRSALRGEASFEGNALSVCRKPYFGLKGGEKGFLKVMVGGNDVSTLEDSREELAFKLAELEDFALENRSIFFNSVDRKQVDELISETGFKENLSEGKNLLAAVKKSAVSFQKVASQF